MNVWAVVASAVTGLLGFFGGGRSEVMKQMQHQIDVLRDDLTNLKAEIKAKDAEIRYRDNYIGMLVQHINDGAPPPPPAWPPMLDRP